MSDGAKCKTITMGFNILLFLYYAYASCYVHLFVPEASSRVPMDTFFKAAPIPAIVVAVLLAAVLGLIGALIVREFWNRLIHNVFSVRELNFQEAFAVIMLTYIFLVT